MFGDYSLYRMLRHAQDKKPLITAYLNNEMVEGLDDNQVIGMSIGVFLIALALVMALWIWAVVATVKHWRRLPPWARVLALIGLLTPVGGPAMTLIAVYGSQ